MRKRRVQSRERRGKREHSSSRVRMCLRPTSAGTERPICRDLREAKSGSMHTDPGTLAAPFRQVRLLRRALLRASARCFIVLLRPAPGRRYALWACCLSNFKQTRREIERTYQSCRSRTSIGEVAVIRGASARESIDRRRRYDLRSFAAREFWTDFR